MTKIDLNADVGEIAGPEGREVDAQLLTVVSSANVACGAHAGDEETLFHLAVQCRSAHVAFGAHPGYRDRENFGRHEVRLSDSELRELLGSQLELALDAANHAGIPLAHIKPHGALYNLAARDEGTARTVAKCVAEWAPASRLVALCGSRLASAGRTAGLAVIEEAFPDRSYEADGTLTDRRLASAVIHDPAGIAAQAVQLALNGRIASRTGHELCLSPGTLCVHGDHPDAVAAALAVRAALEHAGIIVRAPTAW